VTPLKDNKITLYSCGPTVYDKPTIGNWASFIRYDILARALRSSGFELEWIMNITDVGHLVSDADEGEDKLEKSAKREHKTAWQIADYYSDYFIKGAGYFNISIPKKNIVRATDYIGQQIDMIKVLEEKGHTYKTGDGIYFDSTTFSEYGKMARLDIKGLKAGFRIEAGGKKHPTDFALWKFSPERQKRDMEWDSPWGKGFPGWHLECSAIILDTLGPGIDIHTGGIEHIPIHHTNEIAQSESTTGKTLAKTWVHNNHLKINGLKISKSLGNGYTLEDLTKHGFSPLDFRMFVLQSNFRNESDFTWDILSGARQKRLELQAAADLRFQRPNAVAGRDGELNKLKQDIEAAFENNLNTPVVLAVISDLCQRLFGGLIYETDEFIDFLSWLDELLGLELLKSEDISDGQKKLIKTRNQARAEKNWTGADKIRQELGKQGISLKDISDNLSVWTREG
jgi:cysteinyl-tRNA synthetase